MQTQAVQGIMREHGGREFRFAVEEEERSRLWRARHTAYWASLAMKPGCGGYPTDICVPISRLSESIVHAQQTCKVGFAAPRGWAGVHFLNLTNATGYVFESTQSPRTLAFVHRLTDPSC